MQHALQLEAFNTCGMGTCRHMTLHAALMHVQPTPQHALPVFACVHHQVPAGFKLGSLAVRDLTVENGNAAALKVWCRVG